MTVYAGNPSAAIKAEVIPIREPGGKADRVLDDTVAASIELRTRSVTGHLCEAKSKTSKDALCVHLT